MVAAFVCIGEMGVGSLVALMVVFCMVVLFVCLLVCLFRCFAVLRDFVLPSPDLDCLVPACLRLCVLASVSTCLRACLPACCLPAVLPWIPDCLLARGLTACLSVFLFACLPHFSPSARPAGVRQDDAERPHRDQPTDSNPSNV